MTISPVVRPEESDLETNSSDYPDQPNSFFHLSFPWVAFKNSGSLALVGWAAQVQKQERQNQERLAAVYLDPTARQVLDALNRKTSIKWENLFAEVEGEPHDILRSVVLLAGANLCEASPTRLRLSEHGDKLLASTAKQANS